MRRFFVPLILAYGLLFSNTASSRASTGPSPEHTYVGAVKCKMCHNSARKGQQFTKWSQSPHSNAFATLLTPRAKEVAAAKGISDPQKADECLRCHVTGHGAPASSLIDKYRIEDGVGCESCHGPGGDYWRMNVMKDRARSTAAGLVLPTEKVCTGCHNADSPTFKPFDFTTFKERIAHPNPQNAR